jgi:Domain of unknown function (DUF4915)
MATNPTSPVSAAPQPAAMPEEKFALTSSRHFPEWLARAGASLAFTTYEAGKLFLIGLKAGGRLAVFERTFARCMGLGVSPDARSLVLATQYQLLRFDNVVSKGGAHGEHDAVFSPHIAWITGDIDAHDVAIAADGRPSSSRSPRPARWRARAMQCAARRHWTVLRVVRGRHQPKDATASED